jgi:hypothetical protein
MNTFLALTAVLSLAYPTFSLMNQHLHVATPLYPPWQWVLAFAWPALGNRLVLKRPRSLLWLSAFNLVLFLPAGGMFLLTPYASGRWPAVLPALMELALIWIPLASLATQQPDEEDLRRLWESGLVFAAFIALIREVSHTPIPLFQPALLLYLATGVALRALAAAAGASTPDAAGRRSGLPLTVSLAVLVFGAVFGLLVEGRRIAALLLAALQAGWDFLRQLAYYLAWLVDKLGLNQVPGQPAQRPKIPGAPPPVDLGPGLQSGPLWLMIPLWTILIVLLVFLVWMLVRILCENIAAWRREMAASIVPARRRLRRPDFRFFLAAAVSLVRFLVNRLKRWQRRRRPRDLSVLYDAFVLWGRRNRRPRRRSETPGNYLHRLEPEVASACPKLLPALQDLTRRYEQFCYGQNGYAGLIGEEATLVRRLRSSRLHPKKLFGFIPMPVRSGFRTTANASLNKIREVISNG